MNRKEYAALVRDVFSKSKQELHEIYNLGVYNDITKGYCVLALNESDVSPMLIEKILDSFYRIFDLYNASEALKALNDFRNADKKKLSDNKKIAYDDFG